MFVRKQVIGTAAAAALVIALGGTVAWGATQLHQTRALTASQVAAAREADGEQTAADSAQRADHRQAADQDVQIEQARIAAEKAAAEEAARVAAQQEAARVAAEQAATQRAAAEAQRLASAKNAGTPTRGSNGKLASGSPVPFIKSDDPQDANGGYYDTTACASGSGSTVNGVPTCD